MKNIDSYTHTRGESIYLDDIPTLQGTLYGVAYDATIAHGHIHKLDVSDALLCKGVKRIFTAKDIVGENQIGGIILDEPLLAEEEVHFCGMPIAFVVADTELHAREAIKHIKIEIEALPVITDPRIAKEKGKLIMPPRRFEIGNTTEAFESCDYIFEGRAENGGQEHLHIETQGAYAVPLENGGVKVYSSTQGPTAVQRAVAKIIGLPMHMVEVDVTRLGGGFGGKEDQANTWAALCAMASHQLRKPVKYSLHRMEDMRMTGKRHPYSSDFKIGINKDLKIIAYEATFYQNAGAAADLSPAVLERTLLHCTNSYHIPNVHATAYSCRTNLPPNTAFRGFGGPQGMFVIESAIAFAADQLGIDAMEIQKQNLIETGDEFPYGQIAKSEASVCWNKLDEKYHIEKIKAEIKQFNLENKHFKKGMAMMPICFGISFTKTLMNQARALVHVYSDGSVNISTGAVEMGQGVNTKILQVAAQTFSIDTNRIKVNSTNTFRIANTSPSAASATADLNGKATLMACEAILQRIKKLTAQQLNCPEEKIEFKNELLYCDGKSTEHSWTSMVLQAFLNRVSLSEHAHYATPEIHFDLSKEKGHPFAYHVYGSSLFVAIVDCIRGTYTFDEVRVMHDVGKSMNETIDRGQCEGGIVQGIGWMTMEDVVYDTAGKLRSNALSTYKIPDIYSVPKILDVQFHESDADNLAIFRSKAVGEPPLMYGIGAFFALRNAIKAFNPHSDVKMIAPMTPEKVLMSLYH
jgi:xanthine dehydrogenase large subunit